MSTYYKIDESVTSRRDLDPEMKWVVTNIANKLQIPPEKLPPEGYTFSVANVAAEMGLADSTTFYRFRMLVELTILKVVGTKITTHGEVVLYAADRERSDKLLSGEITVPKGLLKKVRERKRASSEAEGGLSPAEEPSSPAEIRISPAESSTQIQYSNSSTQKVPAQSTAYTNSNLAVPSGSPTSPKRSERLGVEIENLKRLAVEKQWPQEYLNHAIDELIRNFGR